MRARTWAAALAAAVALGCDNAGEGRMLSVTATGNVRGFVYFDVNGNDLLDPTLDDSVRNMRVRLLRAVTRDSVATAISATSGLYEFPAVPAGAYVVVLDTTPLADTARVVHIDSTQVTIGPDDTSRVNIGISYPRVTIAQARSAALPVGRRVFVLGVLLSGPGTFRDTTMHLQDTSAAIRATRPRPTTAATADSVRLRATINVRDGQRVLDDGTTFVLGIGQLPAARNVTTGVAATANSGQYDAQLLRVINATISDTATVGFDFRLTVADTLSGSLEVLIDGNVAIPPSQLATFIPGNRFDIIGLSVPTSAAGVWRLKPRFNTDLTRRLP